MEFYLSEETQLLLESLLLYGAVLSVFLVLLAIPCLLVGISSHLWYIKFYCSRFFLASLEGEEISEKENPTEEEDVEQQTKGSVEQQTKEEQTSRQNQEDTALKSKTSDTQNAVLEIITEEP